MTQETKLHNFVDLLNEASKFNRKAWIEPNEEDFYEEEIEDMEEAASILKTSLSNIRVSNSANDEFTEELSQYLMNSDYKRQGDFQIHKINGNIIVMKQVEGADILFVHKKDVNSLPKIMDK